MERAANSFALLRRFVRRGPEMGESCDLCSRELAAGHQHLLEPAGRRLICACDACAVLFSGEGSTKYKRVPRQVRVLNDFRMTDGRWDGLMMPINMAFFFFSSPQKRVVALYPSPAGATESLLEFDTWEEITGENPVLKDMEADVEALLVNRIGYARGFGEPEYFIAPIDECFRLTGMIRSRWQGLSGGAEVWREIGQFFSGLRAHA